MTEAMNIGTMKGKVLFLALALVGFFAIVTITPSSAKAATVTKGYCSATALAPGAVVLNSAGMKTSYGSSSVYCSRTSYVRVTVSLYGADISSNDHLTTRILPSSTQNYQIGAGQRFTFNTLRVPCNEDRPGDDELFSLVKITVFSGNISSTSSSSRGPTVTKSC